MAKEEVFSSSLFGGLKVKMHSDGNAVFWADDVYKALGIDGEASGVWIGQYRLHELVSKSEAEDAEAFESWVESDVIPCMHDKPDVSDAKEDFEVFSNEDFGTLRVLSCNGEPWFIGKEIAAILGYQNQNRDIIRHVDDEDRRMIDGKTQYQNGIELGQRGGWLINESGLYSLILSSKLQNAKKFKRWVTCEVLPSIRKTGSYSRNSQPSLPADYLSALKALVAAEEKKQQLEAENIKQKELIEAARPAVAFTQAVESSSSSCLIGELAKILIQNGVDTGERKLFQWMRDNRYLGSKGERYNIPNQEWMEKGYFELKKGTRIDRNGVIHTTITTKVTGKGQVYFVEKFLKEKKAAI